MCIRDRTIGNPCLDVTDIEQLAEIAHAHDIPLVVDNTTSVSYTHLDVYKRQGWDWLEKFIHIPVFHEEVERVTDRKSLVDIKMTAGAVSYTHLDVYKRQGDSYEPLKELAGSTLEKYRLKIK